MTGAVVGKTRAEAEALFERFQRLITGRIEGSEAETLGKLAVFSGVSAFPMRVKCASLAWHTLRSALAGAPGAVDGSRGRPTDINHLKE
jgi:nitrogen fixation NifU-like protein